MTKLPPWPSSRLYDLAADCATGGFSGADSASRSSSVFAITSFIACAQRGQHGVEGLMVTLEDVKQALTEVKR
jgi:hypothetical protein